MSQAPVPRQVKIAVALLCIPLAIGILLIALFVQGGAHTSPAYLLYLLPLLPGIINLYVALGLLSREAWARAAGTWIFLFTAAIPGILLHTMGFILLIADNNGLYPEDRVGPPPLSVHLIEFGVYFGPVIFYTVCLIVLFLLLRHKDVRSYYSL